MGQIVDHIKRRLGFPANLIMTLGCAILMVIAAIAALFNYGSPIWTILFIGGTFYQGFRFVTMLTGHD